MKKIKNEKDKNEKEKDKNEKNIKTNKEESERIFSCEIF